MLDQNYLIDCWELFLPHCEGVGYVWYVCSSISLICGSKKPFSINDWTKKVLKNWSISGIKFPWIRIHQITTFDKSKYDAVGFCIVNILLSLVIEKLTLNKA